MSEPPSYSHYAFASTQAVPLYTELPSHRERLLHTDPVSPTPSRTARDREYVYKTDCVEINLGRQPWGLHHASYGHKGAVNGIIKFHKRCTHVLRVTMKLEGHIATSVSENAAVVTVMPGVVKRQLINQTLTLYSSPDGDVIPNQKEFDLKIPFPEHVINDIAPLPPTSTVYHPGASAEVSYSLQLDIYRKGLRRHTLFTIPVIYLPKTRPSSPPLIAIPPVLPHLVVDERVRKVELTSIWPKDHSPQPSTARDLPTIHLLLPSPSTFTSGDCIPLALSLTCPSAPAIPKLLTPNIGVFLLKKKKVWINQGRQISIREQLVSKAVEFRMSELQEGTRYLTMEMQAGEPGCESSWMIDGSVGVEYCIRVLIRPPCYAKHLPVFQLDEPVILTTDQYGSLDRELLAMRGVPTPAIGLMVSPPVQNAP